MALTKLGYNVTAVTGKDSKADYLKSLGAKNVVNRAEFDLSLIHISEPTRPY